jgi:hypothetical protein
VALKVSCSGEQHRSCENSLSIRRRTLWVCLGSARVRLTLQRFATSSTLGCV